MKTIKIISTILLLSGLNANVFADGVSVQVNGAVGNVNVAKTEVAVPTVATQIIAPYPVVASLPVMVASPAVALPTVKQVIYYR